MNIRQYATTILYKKKNKNEQIINISLDLEFQLFIEIKAHVYK